MTVKQPDRVIGPVAFKTTAGIVPGATSRKRGGYESTRTNSTGVLPEKMENGAQNNRTRESESRTMIRLIEALNFRCLRYVRQPLGPFHVLVGPNASGKTTFLDVVGFLGRLVSDGLEAAVSERTQNFQDLLFGRAGDSFELAVEAVIPEDRKASLKRSFDTIRYEVKIGLDPDGGEIGILGEKAWLKTWKNASTVRGLFPVEPETPGTILSGKARSGWQGVLTKRYRGNDNFYVEARAPGGGKGWFPSIRLGPRKSALGNLPEDESRFPVATWLKTMLTQGVQSLVLNSLSRMNSA